MTAAASAAGEAARRAQKQGTDVAARVLTEDRVSAASQKVSAVLADERTKAFLAASARAGARAAADVMASRGSAGWLTSVVRSLGTDEAGAPAPLEPPTDRSPGASVVPPVPRTVPGADAVATALAARRSARQAAFPSPALPAPRPVTPGPSALSWPRDLGYPTEPLQLTLGRQDAFRTERHPELHALTLEVSPTPSGPYVLAVEWEGRTSHFTFELDDFPPDWQQVEDAGVVLPVRLRRTGRTTVGASFLDPGRAACEADAAARRRAGSAPAAPSAAAAQAALRSSHQDSLGVIRNQRA